MPKLTITEAAKAAGLSRMTIYKHIKNGLISLERDQFGKPSVDVSELIRVFGELKGVPGHRGQEMTDSDTQNIALQAELKACREMLSTVKQELDRSLEREGWMRARLDAIEQKLLTGPDTKRRWWWPW